MKVKRIFIIALAAIFVVSVGSFVYTYTTTTITIPVTEMGDIATCNSSAIQPDWDSVLAPPTGDTETLRPTATGTYSQCDPNGASPNYACVDEAVADEDSTYVNTRGGATEIDTYNIANHSAGTGTINSVTVYIRSRVTDTSHAVEVAIRTNGTNYFGTYTPISSTSYTNISATWTENPYTTDDWTWAEIDALEAGVRQYDLGTGTVRTTQVYVDVDYGEPSLLGEVPTGDLFDITPNALYTGDLVAKVYLTNSGDLLKAYEYLNVKVYVDGSVEASEIPNYQLLTLQNGEVDFNLQDIAIIPSGSWTQTSQSDFQGGTLNQVDATTSAGDVILDTFSDSVTDSFNDESKIATKTNLVVNGGQVRLTGTPPGTETLRPNGVGTTTEHSPVGETNNWECVDEATPDNDTTYVQNNVDGTWYKDTYAAGDHSAGSGTINKVTVWIRCRVRFDFGTRTCQTLIRTHDTDYQGSDNTPGSSYANYSTEYTANPNTGNPWTWDEIDALEIGVRSYTQYGWNYLRCTQVYVEVDYTGVYDSPGTLTSINLLSGETVVSIDNFDYNASAIPSGTSLKVQFSQDSTNWYNSSGTPDGWDTLSQGTHSINLSGLGWSGANFYYKMEFISDGAGTPVLDEISVNFSTYYASGDLTSSAYDTGDDSDWGTISFTIVEPSATNIQFQIRTAATEGGLSSATWYGPTGTGDYYTTSGTNINSVHDGDRWIQYKAYFSGPGNNTPTLSDVTITYAATATVYTAEVIGGAYCLVSTDTSEWEEGWTVTPELCCEVTQR